MTSRQTTLPLTPVPATTRAAASARRERVVGATALALATSMVAQNAVVLRAGAPDYSAPIGEVLTFHAEHPGTVAVAVGLEALNIPLLLLLVTGLHGLVARRGGAGADWSRLAVAAGATLSSVLVLYAVLWDGVVLAAEGLGEPSPGLELAWQMHAAAFALSMPALGATFVGAALAARGSGLTRSWQAVLGMVGGGLLVIAGTANLAIADGSPLLFVGLPGYAAWLVWLVATGVRLVRAERTAPAS